ncbi:hypothetical protein GCM10027569_71360 [Flindersiella endophytica]
MTDAYKTDAEFDATFEKKVNDVFNAAWDAYSGLQFGDLDVIKQPYAGYRRFAGGSTDAADRMRIAFDERIIPALASVAVDDLHTPIMTIRESYLDGWEGPAADAFIAYLDLLEPALQHLHDSFVAMRGLMECKRSLLIAKRAQILGICGQERAAIREDETTLDEAVDTILSGALDAAFAGAVGVVSGGPVAGAAGAAAALGTHLTKAIVDFVSNDAGAIAESTASAFDDLKTQVEMEQEEINAGIKTLRNKLVDDPNSLLPPPIETPQ